MKLTPIWLLLVLLVVCPQTEPGQVSGSGRVSLKLGTVTVWLGMPKDEALRRLSDAGYLTAPSGNAVVMVAWRDMQSDHGSMLRFEKGRLNYADVSWLENGRSEGEAVLEALGALSQKKGSGTCDVDYAPLSSPDMAGSRVIISCGLRSVLISKVRVQSDIQVGNENGIQVLERIGYLPPAD